MASAPYTLHIYSDHATAIPVGVGVTLTVLAGDTLYYADQPSAGAAANQGTLTSGQKTTILDSPLWVRSHSQTDITVTRVGGATGGVTGWFDVKAFGAVGDGVVDDTAAIQAAINAATGTVALPATCSGVVWFPPGIYMVSNLTWGAAQGLTFKGAGMQSSVLMQKAGTAGFILGGGPTIPAHGWQSFTFEDFGLNCALNPGGTNTGCLDMMAVCESDVNRCFFGYANFACIRASCGPTGGAGTQDFVGCGITKCFFITYSTFPAIFFQTNPNDLLANGQGYCMISGNTFFGSGNADCVGITGVMNGVHITHNTMQQMHNLFDMVAEGTHITHNTFETADGYQKWTLRLNGPGFGSSTGAQSYSNTIAFNSYNNQGSGLTVVDNGIQTFRICDGVLPTQSYPLPYYPFANLPTTNYTLQLSDAGNIVDCRSAGAMNVTIPPKSSVAFPVQTAIEVFQYAAGQVTIVAGAGVTLLSPAGKVKTAAQYSTIRLRQQWDSGGNLWVLSGDLV